MSEFSESYHLRGNDTQAAIDLLHRAKIRGYVYPPGNGWTTFVAEGELFRPNADLVEHNQGLLLHYMSAEDHGWSFALFDKQNLICSYDCGWDPELNIDNGGYEQAALLRVVDPNQRSQIAEIESLLATDDLDEILEAEPSHRFAEFLRLPHFEWLSFEYVDNDYEDGENDSGIIQVS